MGKVKEIDLGDYGERLSPRVLGREIKAEVERILAGGPDTKLVFNLTEVRTMSTGFAKELFGELERELTGEFPNKVRFKFGDNEEMLRRTVARGLKAAHSQKTPA